MCKCEKIKRSIILCKAFLLLLLTTTNSCEVPSLIEPLGGETLKIISFQTQEQIELRHKIDEVLALMGVKDPELAKYTVQAAEEYDLDHILLGALIDSESAYKLGVKHNHPKVKGLGGIHEGFWKVPNDTPEEQIYASAYVLRVFLDKYKQNKLKAVTAYKGVSDVGRRRAQHVISRYNRYSKDSSTQDL